MLSRAAPGRRWINGPGPGAPKDPCHSGGGARLLGTMSGGTDVTDGWTARPTPPPPVPGQPASPWWSDALADPWRDPYAPAAVVVPTAAVSTGPPPEKVADPDAPRRSLTPILLICLVTALLAGGLGGTLGYVFAVRGGLATGAGTQLGATAAEPPAAVNRAPDTLAGVAKKVMPSVVTVRVTGAIGSGFVVSADGY